MPEATAISAKIKPCALRNSPGTLTNFKVSKFLAAKFAMNIWLANKLQVETTEDDLLPIFWIYTK